jgi:alginate O-acetyltransferase complex protein AlgI
MLFNSLVFVGFITVVFLIYPRLRFRQQNLFLLFASYFFYGYWDWRFTSLLLISTVVDFFVGRNVYLSSDHKKRKLLLIISIATNLGILGFFKYFNFFVDSAGIFLATFGLDPHAPVLRIILPVGISFYTFQTMSYTIDIYRRKLKPTNNFIDFALFVSFFPQLVAGPIERAKNLLPQISTPRKMHRDNVLTGLNLVLLGFFKKVAISDSLSPIVESIFSSPAEMSSGQLLTGIYAFSLQIYGDFSGYTDIARGIALILGFRIMENFNAPYLSRNITEFWRRWHISLSTWLRDYLYIPLGGNRRGKLFTYRNLMITMFLGGLWHGAAWTFVIWGVLHGAYLSVHRMLLKGNKPDLLWPNSIGGWIVDFIKIFLTFHLVALTWVFFRAPDFHNALLYFKGLTYFNQLSDLSIPVLFAGVIMLTLDGVQTWSCSHTWLTDRREFGIVRYTVAQLMFFSVITAAIAHIKTVTPFIYFQF